jgi:hypothetical protein
VPTAGPIRPDELAYEGWLRLVLALKDLSREYLDNSLKAAQKNLNAARGQVATVLQM